MRRMKLSGQRFGKLVVLEFADNGNGETRWKCKCDCGKEKIITGRHLKAGTKSCGCFSIENLTGMVFGFLTVLNQAPKRNGRICWQCKCSCGNVTNVLSKDLKVGKTKSCKCFKKICRLTHGESLHNRTREYQTWDAMIQRCTNENNKGYKDYGGRGIKVCERWVTSFENFLQDMGRRPSANHSIDRFPNYNGNYEPGNVRWATRHEQARNHRRNRYLEYGGRRMIMQDWATELKISETSIMTRIKEGKDFYWIYEYYKNKK